ncbi:hypothetical protein Dhaf_2711 [Desulfitobacterium hafniense DCB-2]|uniref:Uncharacterized protein n=1 Tax=Desulfitobacterium hafniense (strain DSM 10664 / DCB-2) TaxID=272564 RepID=B8FWC5_DESHD|nr:hypothetical protein [Desulfitobacterium hafniense]ACL20737.1 hypothetical protein Dhaf_2711 [Desulfitobacterium hafniense DCB-2]
MATLPRITVSISKEDQDVLNKVVERLGLSSPGQLLRMLCSGDADRIEWICKGFKDAHKLF